MTRTVHTILQVLGFIISVGTMATSIVPAKYQPYVVLVVSAAQGALAWYNHNFNPDGTPATIAYVAKLLLLFVLLSSTALAQQQPVFSVSQQAVAVRVGGQTTAASDSIGSFTLMQDSKIGMVQLQSDNILAPGINLQSYLGGVKFYPSALAKLFAKTSLNVAPYAHGAFGIVRNVPAVGDAKQHYSAMADLGFDYKVNNTFSFGPRIGYFNAPGFGTSPHGAIVSANLTVVLGKK